MSTEIQIVTEFFQNHPALEQLGKQGLETVVGIVVRSVRRRLDLSPEATRDRRVDAEIARINEMLEELVDAIGTRRSTKAWDLPAAERESAEPSTVSFVDRSVNSAADSRVESKRRFIGRLIAARLQISESDDGEVVVTAALEIVENMTEKSLLAIAALALVSDIGKPEVSIASLDDAEKWLSTNHGRVVDLILASSGWTDEDLERLGHVGAVSMGLHRSGSFLGGDHADPIDQWLAAQHLSRQELIADDAGRDAHRSRMQARFPISTGLSSLSQGTAFTAPAEKLVAYRLDELRLTSAGRLLGKEILATLKRHESDRS